MGLAACGIEQNNPVSTLTKEEHPLFRISKKGSFVVSNILVLTLLIGAVDYSTRINDGFQDRFSKKEKKLTKRSQSTTFRSPRNRMKRLLMYPRMYQKWNMFSPSVMTYEKWLIADLTFENGETLSLFSGNDDIENKFKSRYIKPYNNQFWRKLFNRLGKSSYQKHIPKFKKWLTNTNYFSEYAGREVDKVQLWQLSEKSPDMDMSASQRPKVTKRELKKTQKGARKSRKNSPKKKQKKQPKNKLPIK